MTARTDRSDPGRYSPAYATGRECVRKSLETYCNISSSTLAVGGEVCVMESDLNACWWLSEGQYAKSGFRSYQESLSYPEKVKQVVLLQQRMVPICATRGLRIDPWKIYG